MTITEMIEAARTLSQDQRLELIQVLVEMMREPTQDKGNTHSLRELRGLGKEIWNNLDAQAYVNQERDEWDRHRES
jgi:hypothetical protein